MPRYGRPLRSAETHFSISRVPPLLFPKARARCSTRAKVGERSCRARARAQICRRIIARARARGRERLFHKWHWRERDESQKSGRGARRKNPRESRRGQARYTPDLLPLQCSAVRESCAEFLMRCGARARRGLAFVNLGRILSLSFSWGAHMRATEGFIARAHH